MILRRKVGAAMLKFAICDDMVTETEALKARIERYPGERNLRIEIDAYSEAQNVLAALKHIVEYDLVFLDIYMEKLNGIDLTRQLRRQGDKSRVIFVSTSMEHALEAYGVNAIQYLVKPVEYEALANAVQLAVADKRQCEETISVVLGNDIMKIPLNNIISTKTQRNYQYIHLDDGQIVKSCMTCTGLYQKLTERDEFVRVEASYVVNLNYVLKVSASDIKLTDARLIPIPRRAAEELKRQYRAYFSI